MMKPEDYMETIERNAHKYYMHNLPSANINPPDWGDDSFWQGFLEGLINWFN
jgi:hypothetical protein